MIRSCPAASGTWPPPGVRPFCCWASVPRPPGSRGRAARQGPGHVLTDLRAAPDSRPGLLRQVISWGGALGIIGGFLWLQIALGQPPRDAGPTLLLALTLFAA